MSRSIFNKAELIFGRAEFRIDPMSCLLVAHAKEVTAVPDVAPNLDRFRKDRAFRYEDFAKRERNVNISPFRAQVCQSLPTVLLQIDGCASSVANSFGNFRVKSNP